VTAEGRGIHEPADQGRAEGSEDGKKNRKKAHLPLVERQHALSFRASHKFKFPMIYRVSSDTTLSEADLEG
jgi:hypothetical protein